MNSDEGAYLRLLHGSHRDLISQTQFMSTLKAEAFKYSDAFVFGQHLSRRFHTSLLFHTS